MAKTKYRIFLNYEDRIRVTGINEDGLMIHDERIEDVEEQRNTLVEMCELVAQEDSKLLLKTLGYLYENFELRSMEVEI